MAHPKYHQISPGAIALPPGQVRPRPPSSAIPASSQGFARIFHQDESGGEAVSVPVPEEFEPPPPEEFVPPPEEVVSGAFVGGEYSRIYNASTVGSGVIMGAALVGVPVALFFLFKKKLKR